METERIAYYFECIQTGYRLESRLPEDSAALAILDPLPLQAPSLQRTAPTRPASSGVQLPRLFPLQAPVGRRRSRPQPTGTLSRGAVDRKTAVRACLHLHRAAMDVIMLNSSVATNLSTI